MPPANAGGSLRFGAHQSYARPPVQDGVLNRLEWLDDLMFAAIDADPNALQAAAEAWRTTLEQLGPDALEESRQQYLRHAQNIWHTLRAEPNHPPHKVFAAIEVISILSHHAW